MIPQSPSIDTIIRFTAATFGVTRMDLLSRRRKMDVCLARHAGYWLCRHMTTRSLPDIAMCFGNRDHTTIMHGVSRIDALMEREPGIRSVIEGMRDALTLPPEFV